MVTQVSASTGSTSGEIQGIGLPGDLDKAVRLSRKHVRASAEIERIKLRATFYNNLSVGLYLSGLLIPFLAAAQRVGEFETAIFEGRALTFRGITIGVGILLGMGLAALGGKQMRQRSEEEIAKINEAYIEENSN